jgi:hypothetical protein
MADENKSLTLALFMKNGVEERLREREKENKKLRQRLVFYDEAETALNGNDNQLSLPFDSEGTYLDHA